MTTRSTRNPKPTETRRSVVLPAGTPGWITEELVQNTLETWQPYYQEELIEEDAIAMIMSVGQLHQFLAESPRHEEIRRPGSRQQP